MEFFILWVAIVGFAITWMIFFEYIGRMDKHTSEIKEEILEIRKQTSELHHCVKEHHGRLCVVEDGKK
jgi:hypothetical protein